MSDFDYFVYDVFTDTAFTGNQLAVFPNASGIPEAALMAICLEFKFSEVTYVYPPQDAAHTAKVRIFAPNREMAFAGHPTIGTAVALYEIGRGTEQVLELGIGPLPCKISDDGAEFANAASLEVLSHPDPALVAACLSLDVSDIVTTRHAPAIASVGNPFVVVEVADRATLGRCQEQVQAMQEVLDRHPESLDCSIYVYCRNSNDVQARMFGRLGGMPEDPATGSAAAALGAFLADLEGPITLDIAQGVEMGRPSRIGVKADGASVTISGQAVKVMAGKLSI